jgi:hypothetical protein
MSTETIIPAGLPGPAGAVPAETLPVPTAAELEELAWVWRSACGDVLSPADWSALSAVGAD